MELRAFARRSIFTTKPVRAGEPLTLDNTAVLRCGKLAYGMHPADHLFVLGRKPNLGAPNRTTGAFATSYRSRVLPTFVNIVDDPTMKDFEGKSLIGSYEVDSEGVRARSVEIVDKGILANYLLGRQPIRHCSCDGAGGDTVHGDAATRDFGGDRF